MSLKFVRLLCKIRGKITVYSATKYDKIVQSHQGSYTESLNIEGAIFWMFIID
jgi:hypothetical protein